MKTVLLEISAWFFVIISILGIFVNVPLPSASLPVLSPELSIDRELLDPALASWDIWGHYSNGQMPIYDEFTGNISSYSYPEGLYGIYIYLLTGQIAFLDAAVQTLRFTAENLINPNGVLMLSDSKTGSVTSTPMPSVQLALYLVAISYIAELQPVEDYTDKIAQAALKFQAPTGLIANTIDQSGSIVDPAEGTRNFGVGFFRLYEVTHNSNYLNAGLRLVDGLWSRRDSKNLIKEQYDAITGLKLDDITRCRGQWQFCALARYANLLTSSPKYFEIYQTALQAMYDTFWFGNHWNYRTDINAWEYNQPMVTSDLLASNDFVNESLADIKNRLIDGLEISQLGLIIHAVNDRGEPIFNSNDAISSQMAAVLSAWEYEYLGNGTNGYETALNLVRALIKYHSKSHGFVVGVNATTGEFYHDLLDDSRLRNGVLISWSAAFLLLKIKGDVKLDFGWGFDAPFLSGNIDDVPIVDLNKFRINMFEGYVKITVQSGTGTISFQTGSRIESVTINDGAYYSFANTTLEIDGPGTYEIKFARDVAVTNIMPSKTVVGKGYNLNVTVTVMNLSNYSETFRVAAYANATTIASQNVTASSGSPLPIIFTWNTSGVSYGNYTLSAWPVSWESNTSNENMTGDAIYVGITGDLNADGIVNILDAILFAKHFLETPSSLGWYSGGANADINGDGVVNNFDATTLTSHFLQHYP